MKEKDLLSSFLVGNELHDSVTFQQFANFFPSAYKNHPDIKSLYRAYLNSRHHVRNKVRRNIDIEVRRNPFHLDQLPTHPEAEPSTVEEQGSISLNEDDMDIEEVDKSLTLDQAIQELVLAERIFKKEIRQLENECNSIAKDFQDLDRDMDAVEVPDKPSTGVDEDALMKDLQELLELSNAIMEGTSANPL